MTPEAGEADNAGVWTITGNGCLPKQRMRESPKLDSQRLLEIHYYCSPAYDRTF